LELEAWSPLASLPLLLPLPLLAASDLAMAWAWKSTWKGQASWRHSGEQWKLFFMSHFERRQRIHCMVASLSGWTQQTCPVFANTDLNHLYLILKR